jgi:hypothetical protein
VTAKDEFAWDDLDLNCTSLSDGSLMPPGELDARDPFILWLLPPAQSFLIAATTKLGEPVGKKDVYTRHPVRWVKIGT